MISGFNQRIKKSLEDRKNLSNDLKKGWIGKKTGDNFLQKKWIDIKKLYENQFWKTSKEDGKRFILFD